ncbi:MULTISPECIES: hypothetical protein [Corallococcus]|nr:MULTISPECIES: hypothetical protein [Corallococcus]
MRLNARPTSCNRTTCLRYDLSVTNHGPEPLDMATVTGPLLAF